MACSASLQPGATGGYGAAGGNGGPDGDANDQLPLIPSPYCDSQISTYVARKGTRPGTR
jgi:hypothetical protein